MKEKFEKSSLYYIGLRKAALQVHEVIGNQISEYSNRFLKDHAPHLSSRAKVDWEGRKRGRPKLRRAYDVFGTSTHPDAAVLAPFKCAFEFDHEGKPNGSDFKEKLMKASVHVLSGRYDACVFVYVLRGTSKRREYLDDGSRYTRKLWSVLRAAGLFVAQVKKPR